MKPETPPTKPETPLIKPADMDEEDWLAGLAADAQAELDAGDLMTDEEMAAFVADLNKP